MTTRLSLKLPPAFGNKTVEVDLKRFSIGRTPENDLAIDDGSLSRRHALIEDLEGRFTLSDCGSSNGTFVNGRQVTTSVELSDWDILTFGGIDDILVRIEGTSPGDDQSASNPVTPPTAIDSQQGRDGVVAPDYPVSTVVAVAAVVIILVVSGVALLIYRSPTNSSKSSISMRQQGSEDRTSDSAVTNDSVASPTAEVGASPNLDGPDSGVESNKDRVIEGYASRVLSSISRDTRPVLTEKPLSAISSQVERYRGSSSLEEEIRTMKRALPQVSAIARSHGVKTPLVVYATLARIDKNGGQGNPVQVAAALCPMLVKMRDVFGDELANDSLLTVAALEEGSSLQGRITRLAGRVNDSPNTIRSIWYLHDHEVISSQTYDFMLRFLAIGVISQEPRKFGVTAEPLVF